MKLGFFSSFGKPMGLGTGVLGGGGYTQQMQSLFGSALLGYWQMYSNVLDISGKGQHGTATNSPTFLGAGLGMQPGTNGYNSIPKTFMDTALNEFTIATFFNYQATSWSNGATGYLFYFVGADNNNRFIAPKAAADGRLSFSHIANSTVKTQFLPAMKHTERMHLACSVSVANNRMILYVNGIPSLTTTGLGTFQGIMSGYARIGNNAGTGWDKNLHDFMVINREITAAEARALAAFSNPIARVYGFDGDSRTSTKSWTQTLYPTLSALYGMVGINEWGVSGQTTAGLISSAAANVDTKLVSGATNVLTVWCGVNSSAQTAQTIHDNLKTYCLARKAAGWNKVVVCTEIDAQDATSNANNWHASKYQALNALLLADYTDFADAIADLGANAALQDATNTTYYNADKLHLVEAGYDVVAGIVGAALAAL